MTAYRCLAAMLLLQLVPPPASAFQRVVRIRDGATLSSSALLAELAGARIILVGESHLYKPHHDHQRFIIEGLGRSTSRLAVAIEMFAARDQAVLDRWSRGAMTVDEFLPHYSRNWKADWSLYRDIFEYVRERRLPLVGINVPKEIARKAARTGFASLDAAELAELPPNVSCDIDADYRRFIERSHRIPSSDDQSFVRFCEAQMLWDKAMAWHIAGYLKRNPDATVVVLAGSGHAWKRGIPRQVAKLTALPVVSVLPRELVVREGRETVTAEDADYLILE